MHIIGKRYRKRDTGESITPGMRLGKEPQNAWHHIMPTNRQTPTLMRMEDRPGVEKCS